MAIEGEVAAGLTLHEATTTAIHGVGAGTIVGTTLAQTLTNKTLTSPVINGTITTTGLTMPAFTLGDTVALNGKTLDAGSGSAQINTTGGNSGLLVSSVQNGAVGAGILLRGYRGAAGQNNDLPARITFQGYNDAATPELIDYGDMQVRIADASDGTEDGRFDWSLKEAGAATINLAMFLASTGVLSLDAAGAGTGLPSLFDEYDDAKELALCLRNGNRERLVELGVMTRKKPEEGGSGYMLGIQPMMNLLAGGIYQTRERIDTLVDVLIEEFPQVAKRLAERNLLALPVGED